MNDITALISKLKVDHKELDTHYIYYDETQMSIHKISPVKEDSEYTVIDVDSEIVEPIISGRERLADYSIFFDYSDKKWTLRKKNNTSFNNITIKEIKDYHEEADLSIVVDSTNIELIPNKSIVEHISIDQSLLTIVVSMKNNPYALYKTFRLTTAEIARSPVLEHQLSKEEFSKGVSIYTNPFFSSYSLKVNNDL
jgi:hypothetical protein